MIRWLYRHIFKGAGILFLIGVLTILFVTITNQLQKTEKARKPPIGARP